MSFFDQSYYAFTKAHMSAMGMWPEQSKYLIRLYDTWGDIDNLLEAIPYILIGVLLLIAMLILNIQHFDEKVSQIKLWFKNIEGHWEVLKNTSAVSVLNEYTERGRNIIVLYAICNYTAMTLYLALYLSPAILDLLDPLNETRPKINMFNAEYGINVEKYYWFVLAFEYMVSTIVIGMAMAMEAMYVLSTVHACALFEVVGFNLELAAYKYSSHKENERTRCNVLNYRNICDCITAHNVAISFANLIESTYSGLFAIVVALTAIMIVFTGVQVLLNLKNPKVMLQFATFTTAQIVSLYLNSIPGQKLLDHSSQIHTIVYNLDWQDMSVQNQKLLIPIMIRSKKPCCLTAEKVYVLSIESFLAIIRTVVSYLMVFAHLVQ